MTRLASLLLCLACLLAQAHCPSLYAQSLPALDIYADIPHHKRVELTPYLAEGEGNTAVIVCPGGSYFWHDMEHEGREVGLWLQAHGISAFVLKYRTGGVPAFVTWYRLLFRGRRYPDPQADLLQALRHVRNHASQYGIDPGRVGAMGFSAGGHLVMSAGELFDTADRPAFVAPIYPVVSLTDPCTHRRSQRGLLGDSRRHNARLCDSLSLERHVGPHCPPVFLVNCVDDPVVDYRNSVLLDSALSAHGVPHVYLQYATGGHGFGASEEKGTEECRQWKREFLRWLHRMGYISIETVAKHAFLRRGRPCVDPLGGPTYTINITQKPCEKGHSLLDKVDARSASTVLQRPTFARGDTRIKPELSSAMEHIDRAFPSYPHVASQPWAADLPSVGRWFASRVSWQNAPHSHCPKFT